MQRVSTRSPGCPRRCCCPAAPAAPASVVLFRAHAWLLSLLFGNQESCLPAAGASGVFKVVTTATMFATDDPVPEAEAGAPVAAAADDADKIMAPVEAPVEAKSAKRAPKPPAAAPITPDQQARLTTLSATLLQNFSRPHFIMASNILDPTSLVKLLVMHLPISAAEMRHHQFPPRYVQLASVRDESLSRAFAAAFAPITQTKQSMIIDAPALVGLLGGAHAAPVVAIGDAEMKGV